MIRCRTLAFRAACLACSLAVAVMMAAGWGRLAFGTPYALLALAKGKVVVAEPSVLQAGEMRVGDRRRVSFTLTNLGDETVWITGMRANCTCIQAEDVPMELPPRVRRPFRIWVRPLPGQAGKPFRQDFDLYLSASGPPVPMAVRVKVAGPLAAP